MTFSRFEINFLLFVSFSESLETVREACRALKVEDVRLPALGPVIMHQLKTEEVEYPPIEEVMATKIFSHPDFQQERKWWDKAGKDPHHILAEATHTNIQGMRAVAISPEEGGKQTKVEWGTLPNVLVANEEKEVDVVWVETEGNADKVELIAHWVGSRLEETSILLSGEATEVEQAITMIGKQVATARSRSSSGQSPPHPMRWLWHCPASLARKRVTMALPSSPPLMSLQQGR